MQRSTGASLWVLPGVAGVVWLAAVLWPAVALVASALGDRADAPFERHRVDAVLATSAGWAGLIALCAALVGWLPGRVLGRALNARGYTVLAALMVAPVCVPAYVLFYAWWQAWPPDSALYRWAVEHDQLALVKGLTVLVGQTSWSWPVVALCVAGFSAQAARQRQELALLDGAGMLRRLGLRLRDDGRGLALGALVVYLFVFNATTSFDIARIYTVGFELRALVAQGAGPATVTAAAAPAIALALLGVLGCWWLAAGRRPADQGRAVPVSRAAALATGLIVAVSVGVPAVLLVAGLGGFAGVGEFARLYGANLVNTIGVALLAGAATLLVTVGLAIAWQARQAWVRRCAAVQTAGWLVAALVPGTVLTTALGAAYNLPGLDWLVYLTPLVLVVGLLGRYAFVGGLLARWVSEREPASHAALRRVDGAVTLAGYLRACRPRLVAAGGAAAAIAAVLSMSDLTIVGGLQPAGFTLIASDILDAIHYQRPRVVMIATVVMLALGVGAAFAATALWYPLRRRGG